MTLPLQTAIEVLLEEDEWFLIRDPFGLVGWATYTGFYHSLFGIYRSCVG